MNKAGEVSRRGVQVVRGMLLTAVVSLVLFLAGLIWIKVRSDETMPLPEELALIFGAVVSLATLVLSISLLYLAGDSTVVKRGQELRVYGVRSSPDPILHLDQALRIVALNPAAERRFGCSGDAVNGMPLRFIMKERTPAAEVVSVTSQEGVEAAALDGSKESKNLALRTGARLSHLVQPMLGFTEIAIDSLDQDHPVQGDLREIGRASARVALLGQALEMFGGAQGTSVEDIDLNLFLSRLEPDLRFVLQPSTRLQLVPAPRPVTVKADLRLTRTAILLLVCNAEEAMPQGATIKISVQLDGLQVSDSGAGLPASALESLFKPMSGTKDAERGVGIGLHAARGAMRLQSGDLKLIESDQPGSVLALVFPTLTDEAAQSGQESGEGTIGAVAAETLTNRAG